VEKMISTCYCTIFGGGQDDWKLLFYLTTKHAFKNFGVRNCPVAPILVAGLTSTLNAHHTPLRLCQQTSKTQAGNQLKTFYSGVKDKICKQSVVRWSTQMVFMMSQTIN